MTSRFASEAVQLNWKMNQDFKKVNTQIFPKEKKIKTYECKHAKFFRQKDFISAQADLAEQVHQMFI
jgi:hypothetical protein